MLITLTRTGGFTGIPIKKTIDTTKLPQEKAKRIEALMSGIPFDSTTYQTEHGYTQGKNTTMAKPGTKWYPDRFTYTLSIKDETISREMHINEESTSEGIKELISILQSL